MGFLGGFLILTIPAGMIYPAPPWMGGFLFIPIVHLIFMVVLSFFFSNWEATK